MTAEIHKIFGVRGYIPGKGREEGKTKGRGTAIAINFFGRTQKQKQKITGLEATSNKNRRSCC